MRQLDRLSRTAFIPMPLIRDNARLPPANPLMAPAQAQRGWLRARARNGCAIALPFAVGRERHTGPAPAAAVISVGANIARARPG